MHGQIKYGRVDGVVITQVINFGIDRCDELGEQFTCRGSGRDGRVFYPTGSHILRRQQYRWELPGNYPVFTVVMLICHYVERIWRILVPPNCLYNIYNHE